MQSNPRLWHSMESLPTLKALMTEWEFALGEQLTYALPFLTPTEHETDTYPCIHASQCGCRHRVVYRSPDQVEAVCDCEDNACEPITLQPADLIIYELNIEKLAEAIRPLLGFDATETAVYGMRTWKIASWGPTLLPVFFSCPMHEGHFLKLLGRLGAEVQSPYVMVTHTNRLATPQVLTTLQRQGCSHISLAQTIGVTPEGQLQLARPIAPILNSITAAQLRSGQSLEKTIARIDRNIQALVPQIKENQARADSEPQANESTAIQLFALIKELESESHWRKAPILQVFRLYCMESLTAEKIARRCNCAKSLVILRLKQLRAKLGRDPATLRQYSDHFSSIETSIRDPRAKKLNPHSFSCQ